MRTKQAGTESVKPGKKPSKSIENVRIMPKATDEKKAENTAKSFEKRENRVINPRIPSLIKPLQ